jgi:hypothetical protein
MVLNRPVKKALKNFIPNHGHEGIRNQVPEHHPLPMGVIEYAEALYEKPDGESNVKQHPEDANPAQDGIAVIAAERADKAASHNKRGQEQAAEARKHEPGIALVGGLNHPSCRFFLKNNADQTHYQRVNNADNGELGAQQTRLPVKECFLGRGVLYRQWLDTGF